jgi:xanthine dehydrogenase accessory factor
MPRWKAYLKPCPGSGGKGTPAALAVVIRVEGSVPRRPGAKMIVLHDRRIFGTLGGGDLEKTIVQEALAAIGEGSPRISAFTLDMEKGKLDMMC